MALAKAGKDQGQPAKPKRPGRWKPGESGNPAGRAPGNSEVGKLRAAIAQHIPEIIAALVKKARDGDARAASLLLDRVVAPLRAVEPGVQLTLGDGSLTDQGRAVLSAIGLGTLTPAQGAQLLAGIGSLGRVAEIDELTARVAALEEKKDAGTTSQSN